ncbi:MAG: AAA family ATPase, partial [Bacteroidota bacterium]
MSTKPQIRTGTDDFADLLLESNVWVDKSLFIKEFLEDSGKVTLITRPRRWGKSLNLDMLRRFLSLEIDAKGYPLPKEECFNDKLFAGGEVVRETGERKQLAPLKIAQHQHLMATYQGRYPVICLGLKNVKGSSYQAIFLQIKKELSTLFKTHSYLLASHRVAEDEKLLLKRYMREEGSVVDVTRSIGFLSELMHKHFQKPVYVLVDEYDTPINHAYLKLLVSSSAFDDVLDLFRQFFGATFKTNPYLAKGLITGILRIAKA